MKKWLNEKSTWLGILGAVIACLEVYQSGGTVVTMLLVALSGFGLTLSDTQR